MLRILACVLFVSILYVCKGGQDGEFFEVDARKLDSNSAVEFGAKLYTDFDDTNSQMIQKIGSVFRLAFMQSVWEVSGVAPAPHDADDDLMDRWVGTIYMVISGDIEAMENTNKRLVDNGVKLVAAAQTSPNSYFTTPKALERRRDHDQAIKEGREPEEWTLERLIEEHEKETSEDKYNIFISESVVDFAKFWASSLDHLHRLNFTMPFIELTFEPDSKDMMFMEPKDYADVVRLAREQIRLRGIPDDKNKIVGPGTSSPTSAKPYIETLVNDRDAYDALYAWSIHIWDRGSSMEDVEREIQGFRQIVKTTVPSSWPRKPVMVTSFGLRPTSPHIYDDVTFNGDLSQCYSRIMGRFQRFEDDLPNTMAQSPAMGVRLLASLIIQYSHGFHQTIYDALVDTPWSHSCFGMFDRRSRQKQIFVAFSTFLTYLTADSVVVRKQWRDSNECYAVALKSSSRLVIAVANPGATSCTRSFSLSGLEVERISDAFTVSYNNGTVSLAATDASEALVLKLPLEYDVFPPDADNDSDVVEFDIVIGPRASATAVINLDKVVTMNAIEDLLNEPFQPESVHSEL